MRLIDAVPAEYECRAAERHPGAVGQRYPAHGLAVDKGPVRRAEVHQDDIAILHPDLGGMSRDARIDETKITIGAAAQDDQRRVDLVGPLRASVRPGFRAGDKEPRCAVKAALWLWQIRHRTADLPVLDGRATDHPGQNPEG